MVLGRNVLYLVGGKSGPPLQNNYVESLQIALDVDGLREGVRVNAMSAAEFIANPPIDGGVVWPYFRGVPCEGEDVLSGFDMIDDRFAVINDYRSGSHNLSNKMANYQQAEKFGIPIPKSFGINEISELEGLDLEFPIVVKGYPSGRGEDVHLCETLEEAKSVYQNLIGKGLGVVAQECIAETRGRDLRVLVVDGKVALVLGRQGAEGSFLSNVSQGGKYFEYELSDDDRGAIEAAIKIFPVDVAGFDFLFSNRGLLFCEINLAPGWTGEAEAMLPLLAELVRSRVERIVTG